MKASYRITSIILTFAILMSIAFQTVVFGSGNGQNSLGGRANSLRSQK